jgi:hypothetical protein
VTSHSPPTARLDLAGSTMTLLPLICLLLPLVTQLVVLVAQVPL